MSSLNDIPPLYPKRYQRFTYLLAWVLVTVLCAVMIIAGGQQFNPMAWVSFAIAGALGCWAATVLVYWHYHNLNSTFRALLVGDWCYWQEPERINAIVRQGPPIQAAARVQDVLQEIRQRLTAIPPSSHPASGQSAHPDTQLLRTSFTQQS